MQNNFWRVHKQDINFFLILHAAQFFFFLKGLQKIFVLNLPTSPQKSIGTPFKNQLDHPSKIKWSAPTSFQDTTDVSKVGINKLKSKDHDRKSRCIYINSSIIKYYNNKLRQLFLTVRLHTQVVVRSMQLIFGTNSVNDSVQLHLISWIIIKHCVRLRPSREQTPNCFCLSNKSDAKI